MQGEVIKICWQRKKWQKEINLAAKSEKNILKEKHDEIERKLQVREKELEDGMVTPIAQSGE